MVDGQHRQRHPYKRRVNREYVRRLHELVLVHNFERICCRSQHPGFQLDKSGRPWGPPRRIYFINGRSVGQFPARECTRTWIDLLDERWRSGNWIGGEKRAEPATGVDSARDWQPGLMSNEYTAAASGSAV